MNVFNLFAKLTLDRSGYEKELNQAEKDTVQANDNIQDSLDESGKSFSKLGEIVAILRSPIDGFKEGLEESREEQELNNKQLDILRNRYADVQESITDLTKRYVESAEQTGENSEQTQKLYKELQKAKSDANGLAKEIDGYSTQTKEAEKDSNNLAQAVGERLHGAFEKTAQVVGALSKTIGVGFVAGVGAIGALTKQATSAYGEFQQLEGGIETLYKSQEAVNLVMENAKNAYRTAGKGTNDYLNTVINMTASLNKATGDVNESARLADVAITDMSDNVNKMGTSMEMVENAYKGFTRGNYTMLDNLALGYAGTKEGMQELLADAQKISGIKYDISSYADIVNAIHVVQTEMGITGTTAKEASDTITGSIGSLKGAWENLVAGFANPKANLGELIKNVVDEAKGAFSNLLPTIKQALGGIATAIAEIAPIIATELPSLLNEIVPSLLSGAQGIISALVQALPTFTKMITDNLPQILETLIPATIEVLISLTQAVIEALPTVIETLVEMLPELISMIIEGFQSIDLSPIIEMLMTLGNDLFTWLVDGLQNGLPLFLEQALPMLLSFSEKLRENAGILVDKGITIIMALVQGLVSALPTLIAYVPQIITNIADIINDNAPKLLKMGWDILVTLVQGIISAIPDLIANLGNIIDMILAIWQAVNWLDLGSKVITLIADGIKAIGASIPTTLESFLKKAVQLVKGIDWAGVGKNIILGIVNGLKAFAGLITDFLLSIMRGAVDAVKKFFGIASPSKLMRDEVGQWIPKGMAVGIEQNAKYVTDAMHDLEEIPSNTKFDPDAPTDNGGTSGGAGGGNTTYVVNINQPVESTEDMIQKTRIELQYGLIKGEPIEGGVA